MSDILLFLGALQLLAMIGTATLGAAAPVLGPAVHLYMGLFTGVFVILVQCLLFVYFLGTGKMIRLAVLENRLDPELHARSRQFKFDVYPVSLLTALLTIATSFLGGGAMAGMMSRELHGILALVTFLTTIYAFRIQLDRVAQNGEVLRTIKTLLGGHELPEPVDSGATAGDETPQASRSRQLLVLAIGGWLPYVYLRFVMRLYWVSPWPFAVFSVICLVRRALSAGSPGPAPGPASSA